MSDIINPRTVVFKCGYWSYEDDEDKGCVIHLSGLTKDQKTVQIQIEGFSPFVYLELPKRIKWNDVKCKAVFEYFKKSMKEKGPIKYKMYIKDKLHYKKSIKTMFMTFPSNTDCKNFSYKCAKLRNVYISGVGNINYGDFVVHEQNIDPILKFTSAKNIYLAGWVEATEDIQYDEEELDEEERKFSSADIDFFSRFNCIKSLDLKEELNIQPTYCSFDGEMYSKNHNAKLSDPKIKENKVFQVSMIFGRLYSKQRQSYLLTLFDPIDIKDVTIIRCKSEKELLLVFSALVMEKDPDIFIGYNIMKFDWNYMIKRAKYAGILDKFMKISRILGKPANVIKNKWTSSAYGEQKFRYPDCHGRINVDVLLEVERNYRMPIYTLNAVSEKFLGKHKDPITARQMFMIYQLTEELLPIVNDESTMTKLKLFKIKQRVNEVLLDRFTKGVVKKFRTNILRSSIKNVKNFIREGMYLIGKYCVKDSILPIDLIEKLNLYTTMEQMSNVMHVPMSYLHTRGQQIKVIAQVYRETIYNNIIIPIQNKKINLNDEKYQGAIVIEANPGDYDDVGMLDFASLYPSMMITYNICYITILEDNDPTPDEECNVLIWSDHVACFKGDTKITVAGDRSILIKDLGNYRESVQALDKECNGTKNYTQTNFFNRGIKKCIKLTLEDGSILECTSDHRIRTENREWVEAKDLILNETRILSGYTPPVFDMENEELNICGKKFVGLELYKFMKLLGFLCSDGHISSGHVNISSGHPIDNISISDDIEYLTGVKPIIKKQTYGWNISITGWLNKLIRNIPGVMEGNKQKQLRTLPEFIENSSVNIIRSFLSGLFGGDGHTFSFSPNAQSIGSIRLSWTSEKIEYLIPVFDKLQIYLGKCRIKSTLTQSKQTRIINIHVSDCIKFKELIGFSYSCRKSMRLEAGCRYLQFRENVWTQQKRIIETIRTLKIEISSQKKKFKIDDLIKIAIEQEKFFYNYYYSHPTSTQLTELLCSRVKWEKPMFSRSHFPGPMEYMESIGAKELFTVNTKTKYGVDINSESLPLFKLKVIGREEIGEHEVFDIEVNDSHSFLANGVVAHNCEHDPQKRKRKKEDVMCCDQRYRFKKVKIVYNEKTGEITRNDEGLMPRLERNLLASRSIVKKEMFKADAKLKMQRGLTTGKDIEYYKKIGLEIIEKGSLGKNQEMMLEVSYNVLNAKQLAIKVSANSCASTCPIPCLVNGKFEYRSIESLFDSTSAKIDEEGNEISSSLKDILVWSDAGWADIKYVFRHKNSEKLHRVLTHTGCVDVTSDHSLLDEEGKEVKATELIKGDKLLHVDVPLPDDTPEKPEYLYNKDVYSHKISSEEEKKAFNYGLLFSNERKYVINYMSSSYKTRLAFFAGYCSSNKDNNEKKPGITIFNNSHIGSASLFYVARSLGYKVDISTTNDENLFILKCYDKFEGYKGSEIKNIELISVKKKTIHNIDVLSIINYNKIGENVFYNQESEYVYDIETSTHHFAAGIGNMIVHNSAYGAMGAKTGFIPFIPGAASVTAMGRRLITMAIDKIKETWINCKLVYGDTDSCMIKFMGCSLSESFELCEIASKMTTHYLKSYVLNLPEDYVVITKSGTEYTLNKITSKHKDFINLSYDDKISVIEYESTPIDLEFESMFGRLLLLTKKRYIAHTVNKEGEVIDKVNKGVVLARRDNSNYLRSAYKKLTDAVLDEYSEDMLMDILHQEIHNLFIRKVPDINLIIYMGVKNVMSYAKKKEIEKKSNYSTNSVVYYIDSNGDPIDNPLGPTDPRLEYRNLPQCLLSLKMLRRGVDIPPNTRLEFLYLENINATHQGHRAEDYTYYMENKKEDKLKPDRLHYIEKQLSKPVTELLSVKYPKDLIIYEDLEKHINRLFRDIRLSDLKKNRLAKIHKFEKSPILNDKLKGITIGWEIFNELCYNLKWNKSIKDLFDDKLSPEKNIIYNFKSINAKVEFVLDSSKKIGMNEFNPNKEPDREIINICRTWKARYILNKISKQYGVKKRPHKRPTQRGIKLRKNTKIILICNFSGQYSNSLGMIIDVHEIGFDKDKTYCYDILMKDREEIIIKNVPRNIIATYYFKDSTIMKDIFNARVAYNNIVNHIEELSNRLIFLE
jgi:DNA polymerase elongation subunit (family B)